MASSDAGPDVISSSPYPNISLLLTGGHTQIYLIESINKIKLLGETLDDAMGEAFDKVAKLLKLPYPGGPSLEKKATKGNPSTYELPHPLKKNKDLNFSFSGIKTAVSLIVNKQKKIDDKFIENMSASFQKKITDILECKIHLVMQHLTKNNIKISQLSLVGGVAANKYILNTIEKTTKKYNCNIIMPPNYMLSDNAAMIAWACIQKKLNKNNSDIFFKPDPKLSIKTSNI